MKYKKRNKIRNNRGFTIIESLAYIFLTTIILVEGISLYISVYKSYLETQSLTIKCNDYQNFYINLDNIIAEGNIEKIVANSDNIIFSKDNKAENINKIIKAFDGKIVVKYTKYGSNETINYMLKDIDRLEVKTKKNLIYLIIYDEEGKEFIKCI
jgi:Tfp pilus assembly protein PilW